MDATLRPWNNWVATPATSSATKCGTSHITGLLLRSAKPTSPSTWIRFFRRAGVANHNTPRSNKLRASH